MLRMMRRLVTILRICRVLWLRSMVGCMRVLRRCMVWRCWFLSCLWVRLILAWLVTVRFGGPCVGRRIVVLSVIWIGRAWCMVLCWCGIRLFRLGFLMIRFRLWLVWRLVCGTWIGWVIIMLVGCLILWILLLRVWRWTDLGFLRWMVLCWLIRFLGVRRLVVMRGRRLCRRWTWYGWCLLGWRLRCSCGSGLGLCVMIGLTLLTLCCTWWRLFAVVWLLTMVVLVYFRWCPGLARCWLRPCTWLSRCRGFGSRSGLVRWVY